MTQESAKRSVGYLAATRIHPFMKVGLGTGSTVKYFIEHLALRCQQGLSIQAVASSIQSARQAESLGIPLMDPKEFDSLDITVDGADEIDDNYSMIKGGGGALVREKIIAYASKEVLIIVDESKLVKTLGMGKIPIEILPFALQATIRHLQTKGYQGVLRKANNDTLYLTDNGNYIYDLHMPHGCQHPHEDQAIFQSIPGIVGTGLFLGIATHVLVGHYDGSVTEKKP